MKKATLCFLSALCFLPLMMRAQGANKLDQVFSKMDEVAKTFRSTQADIERTHVTVLVNDRDVASGKFYYALRGKEPRVKMELTKPIEQFALIDNGQLQLYTPSQKDLKVASLGQHKDLLEMFMALGFGQSSQDLMKNFDVTLGGEEAIDGKNTTILDLKPKQAGIKSVRMWMDQQRWVAVQLKVTENTNDYFVIKYTNIKLNGTIPESIFQLKVPKDVKPQRL